jgi:hypothetical protein
MAWLMGILIPVYFLWSGISEGSTGGLVVGIMVGVIGGFLSFIVLYALSQFIYVAIDIERNTRTTVRALLEEVEEEEGEAEEGEEEEEEAEEGETEEGETEKGE